MNLRMVSTAIALALSAMLLGTGLYQNVVDASNYKGASTTASYREHGRLVLYRATSIDPNTPKGVTLMFERGNLHTLDEGSILLFSVPADFKKEQ